ncbi:MAG: hypothetical protein ABI609_05620 [Acidobacteriota bacterium]
MSIRRRGLWFAYGALFVFYTVLLFSPPPIGEMVKGEVISSAQLWPVAGRFMVALNVYFPVAVGILCADRMQRDYRLGLRELQESTPLRSAQYVLAKYFGVLASVLLPVFVWVMVIVGVMIGIGHAPSAILMAQPVAFAVITIPAFAFVVAFSLACPLVMPTSIFQILFTGYWFWANFIPPKLFPTLNGTLLTPSGVFALQGFFHGRASLTNKEPLIYSAHDATLNLAVLGGSVVVLLVLVERLLARRARLA